MLYQSTQVIVPDKQFHESTFTASMMSLSMTNALCELDHMILTSTGVPILLSEYQKP